MMGCSHHAPRLLPLGVSGKVPPFTPLLDTIVSVCTQRFSSRANSPRVQFSCLKKSSSTETKPYDRTGLQTLKNREGGGGGGWKGGGEIMCVCGLGGGERRRRTTL